MLIHKFNLKDYVLKTHKAFVFFEVLMKMNSIRKTKLLDDLHIPATSYRYAKRKEQNVGKEILFKLEKHFQINSLSIEKVEEYENTLSKLYQDIYYRNIDNISKYSHKIEQYIEDNNILKPIFMIYKIWIIFIDMKNTPKENRERSKSLFLEVSKYYEFFTDEVKAVFKLIEILSADSTIDTDEIFHLSNEIPYLKGMIYFSLTTNSLISFDYKSVIIYGRMCEEELIKDYNYKRLWNLIINVVASLNALGHYRLANEKLVRKILSMNSFNINDGVYNSLMNHYYISLIGIDETEDALRIIESKDEKTPFEYLTLMLIYYKREKSNEVQSCYEHLLKLDETSVYFKISRKVYQIINVVNVNENLEYLEERFYAGYVNLLRKFIRRKK